MSNVESLRFRSKVVIGLIGIDGSSVQFLYGLMMERRLTPITPPSLSPSAAALVNGDSVHHALPPVMLFDHGDISFLLLNVKPRSNECIRFVSSCFDLLKEKCEVDLLSEGHLIILTTLRMTQTPDAGLYSIELHGQGKGQPSGRTLPENFKISDAMFASWLHFADVLQIHTTCLLTPGYRPDLSGSLSVETSSDVAFQRGLRDLLSIDAPYKPIALKIAKRVWSASMEENDVFYM